VKKLIGPVIAAGAAALVLVPGVETLGNLGPGHSSGYLYKHIMSKLAVSAPKSRDNLFSPEQSGQLIGFAIKNLCPDQLYKLERH
jgi:hypothetical protein